MIRPFIAVLAAAALLATAAVAGAAQLAATEPDAAVDGLHRASATWPGQNVLVP
jgi:hypothetical protein